MNDGINPVFLIGGGWRPEAFKYTYGPFIEAAKQRGKGNIVLVIVAEDGTTREEANARFRSPFESLSVAAHEIVTIYVSKSRPLTRETLVSAEPAGVFVCGGATPLYQELLCADKAWLGYVQEMRLPYGGFSAGAAITAERAIVGGWALCQNGNKTPIIDREVAEDLECISVRDGLGLVPFSIDVHCGQWGTITRLIHAVNEGLVEIGWGIDEDTMLQLDRDTATVHGLGQVYRVQRVDQAKLLVEIFGAGTSIGA